MANQICANHNKVLHLKGLVEKKVRDAKKSEKLDPETFRQKIVAEIVTPHGPEQYTVERAEQQFERDFPDYLSGNILKRGNNLLKML